jgi:serine/threonine-protein kinase
MESILPLHPPAPLVGSGQMGAAGEQRLLETASLALPYSISPDGRRLGYYEFNPKTEFDIWTVSLDLSDPDHPKAGKPELFLGTPTSERNPSFSPDGKWRAYDSMESGNYEVYVRPFPLGSAKWQVSTGGGTFPLWSQDGRQLFFETLDNRIMVADCAAKGESFEAGKPRLWSPRRVASTFPFMNLALHPDGKRFLVFPTADASGKAATGVHAAFLLNFTDELKRRIP